MIKCFPSKGCKFRVNSPYKTYHQQMLSLKNVHPTTCSPYKSSYYKMFTLQNFHTTKCSHYKMFTLQNVHTTKCSPYKMFTLQNRRLKSGHYLCQDGQSDVVCYLFSFFNADLFTFNYPIIFLPSATTSKAISKFKKEKSFYM